MEVKEHPLWGDLEAFQHSWNKIRISAATPGMYINSLGLQLQALDCLEGGEHLV